MSYDDDSPTITESTGGWSAVSRPQRRLSLVVYHRDGVEVLPLSEGVAVVVGRAPPATVVLRDPSLSRQHARLCLDEEVVRVEDLGSTNGTFVNGDRVRDGMLHVGDEARLGSVSVSLHAMTPLEGQLQGVEGHDRFVALLDDEVVRARTFSRKLALMMVRAQGAAGGSLGRWCPRVRQLLRPVDRVGLYGPTAIELLLPETDDNGARRLASAIVGGRGDDEPELRCGVAIFPDAAGSPGELMEVCLRSLQQTSPRSAIHVAGGQALARVDSSVAGGDRPVVHSPKMVAVYRTVDRVASSTVPVLIVGETGTGKELVARAIHEQGGRRQRPMRSINCGAIPQQLLESALFGHERGAFTGADRRSAGLFEAADGGTVFLDEIGELSLASQVALLRVLETKRIVRVGSNREVRVDVRVVAATNRDLEQMCREERFRRDLLYRLNTMVIALPPLRERREEIQPLAEHFLRQAADAEATVVRGIGPDALAVLRAHDWPGNVRELRNVIERAVIIARGELIQVDDLPERLCAVAEAAMSRPADTLSPVARLGRLAHGLGERRQRTLTAPHPVARRPEGATRRVTLAPAGESAVARTQVEPSQQGGRSLKQRVEAFEAGLLAAALELCDGNQTRAATLLDMPRRTLVYKLGKLDVEGGPAEQGPRIDPGLLDGGSSFKELVEHFEAETLRVTLQARRGDRRQAAADLGLAERTLVRKLRQRGVDG